jgi:hypothetical protein
MNDMPVTPPAPEASPSAPDPETRPARGRRALKVAVGLGAAAGVAVGATAVVATTSGHTQNADATVTASGSTSTTTPATPHVHGFGPGRFGGRFGGPAGLGGIGIGDGPLLYGYETLAERTGTVSDVTDTSGSTWSLTVKSADGTSGSFTVDSGTSVNGGEMGIGSVKKGDTVRVTAVVSGNTSTAKQVIDQTTLKANGGTWQPMAPQPDPSAKPGTSSTQTNAPPV